MFIRKKDIEEIIVRNNSIMAEIKTRLEKLYNAGLEYAYIYINNTPYYNHNTIRVKVDKKYENIYEQSLIGCIGDMCKSIVKYVRPYDDNILRVTFNETKFCSIPENADMDHADIINAVNLINEFIAYNWAGLHGVEFKLNNKNFVSMATTANGKAIIELPAVLYEKLDTVLSEMIICKFLR